MNLKNFALSTVLAVFGYSSVTLAAPGDVLAIVNGTKITQHMLDLYAKQRGVEDAAKITPEQKKRLVEELVNREVLFRSALQQKLDKKPEISAELDNARFNILASIAVRNKIESQGPVTDDSLKAGYEKYLKELPGLEYKTRHILVDNEAKAISLIADLDKDGDFAKLANENTTGTADGGELEWFNPADMIKPYVDAVMKLEKDQYTKAPVHTQYGWHIIQLQDTRKLTPPGFDDVKEQIRMNARNAAIETYVKSLRDQAKVEIK